MRARSLLAGAFLSIGLLAGVVPAARACSTEQPTFEHAVRSATSIARVTIVDQWEPGGADGSATYEVLDTLKGSVSGTVHLADPRGTLCGDDFLGNVGEEAIVAFGVPFSGESLTIGWFMSEETAAVLWGLRPVTGSTSVPDTVENLDDLADAIRDLLPDTALATPAVPPASALGWVLVGTAVAIVLRRTISPPNRPGAVAEG